MTIGSMIAQARKKAGLSIEDLSASTKIRVPLLLEMESNNFINCGGETYLRGHIKIIASKLGVDPKILLAVFDEENLEIQHSMRNLLIENNDMPASQRLSKVSWKALITISVFTLLVAGVARIVLSTP
jgi:cytoskeletal protein RodZ